MNNELTTSTAREGEHIKGFVSSYAKCWEHFEAYMQDPANTPQGFTKACLEEAAEQGIDIKLPAPKTIANRMTRLLKAEAIPERTTSDTPDAVRMRNKRADEQIPKSGKCSPTDQSNTPNTESHDSQEVSILQPPADTCSVVDVEIVGDLQVGEPEVDISRLTPVLEQLLFTIEAARKHSNNTPGQWGSLSAMLQTLYHHAQCEAKQRRLHRDRQAAE